MTGYTVKTIGSIAILPVGEYFQLYRDGTGKYNALPCMALAAITYVDDEKPRDIKHRIMGVVTETDLFGETDMMIPSHEAGVVSAKELQEMKDRGEIAEIA